MVIRLEVKKPVFSKKRYGSIPPSSQIQTLEILSIQIYSILNYKNAGSETSSLSGFVKKSGYKNIRGSDFEQQNRYLKEHNTPLSFFSINRTRNMKTALTKLKIPVPQ